MAGRSDPTLAGRLEPMVGTHVPGLAVAVVGTEGIRDAAGVGVADIATGSAASPQMVCPWFSMTKIVTATATMHLVDQGSVDLDAPVAPLVPALERMRPASWAAAITPRHLLSHGAGFANPIPVSWVQPAGSPAPDPDAFLVEKLSMHRKLRFEPGSRSSYSNLSTLVLGELITTVTGSALGDVVHREVLDPLGMRHTDFVYTREMQSRAATGYHPKWSPMRVFLPRWVVGKAQGTWVSLEPFLLDGQPYGGLVGSLEDAARFLRMHLNDGELDGTRVLTEGSARAMRQITLRGKRYDLGLGWFRPVDQRDASPAFVEHLGGGAGFFNVIRVYPSEGVGVAIMGNATKYDIDGMARAAVGV
ncbi:MAG: serine hydrolase domain-containing protein [Actinomycetota bacterium]